MIWEHSHRVIAGSVGILSLVLALWLTFKEDRKWLIGLAWLSFGLVFLQALLGGLTVLMRLPPFVSIAHAVIGQLFLGFMVTLAFFQSPYYWCHQGGAEARDPALILLGGLGLVFVLTQLILGSTVRHMQHAVVEHISFALPVTLGLLVLAFYAVYRHRTRKKLLSMSFRLAAVLIIQVFLGMGAFVFKELATPSSSSPAYKILFTMMHQTVGAVVLGLVALMWLMSFYPEEAKNDPAK